MPDLVFGSLRSLIVETLVPVLGAIVSCFWRSVRGVILESVFPWWRLLCKKRIQQYCITASTVQPKEKRKVWGNMGVALRLEEASWQDPDRRSRRNALHRNVPRDFGPRGASASPFLCVPMSVL